MNGQNGWLKGVWTVAMAAFALLAGGEAWAADFNKASDVWNNAANWTPNGLPTTATNCVIGSATLADATASIGTGDACSSAYLYLGNGAGRRGTLNMSDGTLTGASTLNLAQGASSTGIINQTGGTVANYTQTYLGESGNGSWNMSGSATVTNLAGSFYVGYNAGSVGKLRQQDSAVWSNSFPTYLRVGVNGDGTVEVNGGTFWITKINGAGSLELGGAGGVGRLIQTGGTATVGSSGLSLGYSATGTGVLSVAGGTYNGGIKIGNPGRGYLYATNNAVLNCSVFMGYGSGSNAYMLVDGSAAVTAYSADGQVCQIGNAAGNVSVLDLKGGSSLFSSGMNWKDTVSIGCLAGATGIVNVTGGTHVWRVNPATAGAIGSAGRGIVNISGGSLCLTNGSPFTLGLQAGGYGEVRVTGGNWILPVGVNIGINAGGTGIVSVANCVQTNIAGAVTVGGGTTVGDRYGLITITNGTFGGGMAVTVWTNGFVELTGTGSLLRCNTFTCRGGAVTNRIRQFAGGVDVTNSASTALVVTNGGRMHLSFEEIPSSSMDVWGLRWSGDNHSTDIQAMVNSGALTWSQSGGPAVAILTNATHTWVGYVYMAGAAPTIDQGNSVTTNVNEDVGTVSLASLITATDPDSSPAQLSWTNTTTAANGAVVCGGTGTSPATLTYTPAANFNGTNNVVVRVMDEGGRAASLTVTVVVAAINDPPVNTTLPSVSGELVPGGTLTVTSGAWNDTSDTNVGGSSTLAYSYEWQYSTTNDGSGVTSLGDNDTQYTVGSPVVAGNYVRVQVTCTNEGVGTPQVQVVVTNSLWVIVNASNTAPVIEAVNLSAGMDEDSGAVNLADQIILTASDADGDALTWTNTTTPANGVVAVNGTGTNPVTWTPFTYTPGSNFYGTDSFVLRVSDGKGGFASVTGTVVVAAVNDRPVNTVVPGFTGTNKLDNTLTATNGVWNDNADTNASYTAADFASGATFAYQWWRSDNAGGSPSNAIAGATASTYTLAYDDKYKWIAVSVTCTDGGVPGSASNTAWSAWMKETSTLPTLVTFTNVLENGAWGTYANWAPDTVPMAGIDTVIGDVNVKSPVEATIGTGEAAATRYLYLGNNTGASGTLNMNGATLTGGGALRFGNGTSSTGIISQTAGTMSGYVHTYVGYNSSSYGSWTLSGNATATGIGGSLYVGEGVGAVGRIVVQDSAVWSNFNNEAYQRIGSGTNSDGTVEVRGGKFWLGNGNGKWLVGAGVGSIGRLLVSGGEMVVASGQGAQLGDNATGTGIVTVAGGTLTSAALGVGPGAGYVYVTNNGTLTSAVTLGTGAGSNAYLVVDHNATFASGYLRVGCAAGNVSVVDLKGGRTTIDTSNGEDWLAIGYSAGSTGIVSITGGTHAWSGTPRSLGRFAGSLGRLTIAGGSLLSPALVVGDVGMGELNVEGGVYTNNAGLTLGNTAGSVGRMRVTGGLWIQGGGMGIGSAAAGVTGVVTVANCVQTNVAGAVTVGGGTTVGDRYGSVTVSNATFGGGTAMTVLTNGFVELTGTGSVLRCSTFTCRGGTVTNRVRQVAGGVDITGATLVVTNGGKMHLVFEQDPVGAGDFWGLRWAGNNHAAALAALTNANVLTWNVSALYPTYQGVGIYTNATDTFVGVVVERITPRGMLLMVQ